MDPTITTTTTNITPTSTPEAENDTPPQSQTLPIEPLSFSTFSLKKNHNHNHNHHHFHHHHNPSPVHEVVTYKECLKNHAANLGGRALDGCGEFMPSPTATPSDPTSLKCAACGCHRNFHRRETTDSTTGTTHFLDFYHHHHRFPPHLASPSPSPPPPPISTNYPHATHMILALSTALQPEDHQPTANHQQLVATPTTPRPVKAENPSGRKRFRTKFSQEQKEKMFSFSEKLGWKMQKSDEGQVEEFCKEVGVRKGVLKVWMHNNKHTFGKRSMINNISSNSNFSNGRVSFDNNGGHNINNNNDGNSNSQNINESNGVDFHVSTNGSSSSS